MSDLPHLVQRLVEVVAARDPGLLSAPIVLADIHTRLLPYRACRRALDLGCAEDYDLLVLELAAEAQGLAHTHPPEAAEACRREVAGANPDLGLLHRLEGVTVHLDLARLEQVMAEIQAAEEVGGAEGAAEAAAPLDLELETEAEPHEGEAADRSVPHAEGQDHLPDDLKLPPEMAVEIVTAVEAALPIEDEWEELPTEAGNVEPPAPVEADRDEGDQGGRAAADEAEEPDEPEVLDLDLRGQQLSAELQSLLALATEFAGEGFTLPPDVAATEREERGHQPSHQQPPAASHPAPPHCPHCAGQLPAGRPVRFCPHCGRNLVPLTCVRCHADLQPDWRHCVMCGFPTADDSRFA